MKIDQVLRKQLSVIILVTVVGIVTGWFILSFVRDNAGTFDAGMFSALMYLIPCALMLIGSFVVAATATEIGRTLYIASLAICVTTGVISMFIVSAWMSDPAVTTLLLANSAEGTTIVPPLKSAMTIFRNVASYIVVPTVGCILGAWVGSRLHPMTAAPSTKSNKSKAKNPTKKR